MKSCLRIILVVLIALVFVLGLLPESSAQRRLAPFSHFTRAHKEGKYSNCSSCHLLPTKNWTAARRDKQDPFPDVATFPSHTSCFGCHTKDIYSNGGAFCGTCHTVPTMRARAVLAFPIRSHSRQFTTFFPHDVHQDIIALNDRKTDVAVAHFVLASFRADDKKPQFNNCAICHSTPENLPKYGARALLKTQQPLSELQPDIFDPKQLIKAGFFKDMPESHASCFSCHYQGVKPVGTDCAGCHKFADKPYFESSAFRRYSLKFDHGSPADHATRDCTSCHVRITQNPDVRLMKDADVPISACGTCHGKAANGLPATDEKYFEAAMANEIDERESKKQAFQCSYCHTSAIGRFPVPKSHLDAVPPAK